MEFYGMLHGHSTHSDGVLTPAEMVKVAKDEGYKAIAITDHDTATAYPELKAACEAEDMECLFGVEFSSMPTGLHLVALALTLRSLKLSSTLPIWAHAKPTIQKNALTHRLQGAPFRVSPGMRF